MRIFLIKLYYISTHRRFGVIHLNKLKQCANLGGFDKDATLHQIYTEMLDAGKDLTGITHYVQSWYEASQDRSNWPEIQLVTTATLHENAVKYAKWLGVKMKDLHKFSGFAFDTSKRKTKNPPGVDADERKKAIRLFENVTKIISLVELLGASGSDDDDGEEPHLDSAAVGLAALSGGGIATKCTFCEGQGGIVNLDLEVPNTGGNTCGSIKLMAAREVNGTDVCATMLKEERVCCPGPATHQVETGTGEEEESVKAIDSIIEQGNHSHPPKSKAKELNYSALQNFCNETNSIVNNVYNHALLNESQVGFWQQDAPFSTLNCEQLTRSISGQVATSHNDTSNHRQRFSLSLQRLGAKTKLLEIGSTSNSPLKIIVIGGSMTAGHFDFPIRKHDRNAAWSRKLDDRNAAWPRKLEQFMHEKWNKDSVQVVNLAEGGADENTWLGRLDVIMNHAPFDIILVESAVNDQCDYKDQKTKERLVDAESHRLLKALMNFPSEPAVFSVELFRTAYSSRGDADSHCRDHVEQVANTTNNKECLYCTQWWKPQDWRHRAREKNSVSYISYRDAVWPTLDQPPQNLCHEYWAGLSHPQAGTHALVASTILFQFLIATTKDL